MTDDNTNPTEWLANSSTGYGWGRTQQDAINNMLAKMDPIPDRLDKVIVDTVEHRGDASVGLTGWRVDQFVSGERLTFDAVTFEKARVAVMEAHVKAERLTDDPVDFETIE